MNSDRGIFEPSGMAKRRIEVKRAVIVASFNEWLIEAEISRGKAPNNTTP